MKGRKEGKDEEINREDSASAEKEEKEVKSQSVRTSADRKSVV